MSSPTPTGHLLLNQILNEAHAREKTQSPLQAVFDLDSTLFCVSHRTRRILQELAHDPELLNRFPDSTKALAQIEVTPRDWGIRQALERAQIKGTIDFFECLRQKWSDRFFSSSHLHLDEPYPGAVDFVRRLAQAGAKIHYLTGRDRPRMLKGTLGSLQKWDFPLADAMNLHMKPNSQRHDAEFKRDILSDLGLEHEAGYFFENEPVIINLVRRTLPKVKIIFIDSVHSGREESPEDLPILAMSYELTPSK